MFVKELNKRYKVRCLNPWTNLSINNNEIKVCTASRVVIARLTKDTSLQDFWNGERIKRLRSHMLLGNLTEICHGACSVLHDERDVFQKFKRNRKRLTAEESFLFELVRKGVDKVALPPLSITLAMDHSCNLKCSMCENIRTYPDYIISPRIYRLIDELAPNLKKIFFTGGEPFHSPKAVHLIHYCKQRGYDFNYGFFTNGLCVNMDLLEKIHIDEIYISLDGATKNTYEKIRKGASFEQLMANLDKLLDFRKRYGRFEINVMFVVMKSNFKEIPLMIRRFAEKKVSVRFAPFIGSPRHPENIFRPGRHLLPLLLLLRSVMANIRDKDTLNSLEIVEGAVIKSLFEDSVSA